MTQPTKRALLVIDLQNDYFAGGNYPLWNTEDTLGKVETAIKLAQDAGDSVILIQHIASSDTAPFFKPGTSGVEIHPQVRALAPDAPVVVKTFADGFRNTTLEQTLVELGIESLLLCGMMTQNCVTHTAISDAARKYQVAVLADGCTTVDEMIHKIALSALAPTVPLIAVDDAYPQ